MPGVMVITDPGPHMRVIAVQLQMQLAMQHVEGLFLLLVILLGMFLARQHDDELLAIMAVDDGHHGDAEFVETIDAVMMRDFQLSLAGNDAAALVQQFLYARYDGADFCPHLLALRVVVGHGGVGGNVPGRMEKAVFRPVIGGDRTRKRRNCEEHVLVAQPFARLDRLPGENAATQADERVKFGPEGSILWPAIPQMEKAWRAASSQARTCRGFAE